MNLVTHLLKKDLRRHRALLALWIILIAATLALTAPPLHPMAHGREIFREGIATMTPILTIFVLIAFIPPVIQEEPLVGSTAFWLTRPIPRRELLSSKSIFILLVLVALPLAAQFISLYSNGASISQLALGTLEVGVEYLAATAIIAFFAVITPSMGRFVIAAVCALVGLVILGASIKWIALYWPGNHGISDYQAPGTLDTCHDIVIYLTFIIVTALAIAHQYLTRNTARTVAIALAGLLIPFATARLWTWDFLSRPPIPATSQDFDTAAANPSLYGNLSIGDITLVNDRTPSLKNIQARIIVGSLPKGDIAGISKVRASVTTADGRPVDIMPASVAFGSQVRTDALEFALGGIPILNGPRFESSPVFVTFASLFTLDPASFGQLSATPLNVSATLSIAAYRYQETASLPLGRHARFTRGSDQILISDIVPRDNGVDLYLNERNIDLSFAGADSHGVIPALDTQRVAYLLVNRERREAVISTEPGYNNSSGGYIFPPVIKDSPIHLSFSQDNSDQFLSARLTPEWLAGANLVRMELVPVVQYTKVLVLKNVSLANGSTTSSHPWKRTPPDSADLGKITLPDHPAKPQVLHYIKAILIASRAQGISRGVKDPQVAMLEKVGPENLDALIEARSGMNSGEVPSTYLDEAINALARPEDKTLILQSLPEDTNLITIVIKFGWQTEARDLLIHTFVNDQGLLGPDWVKAIAGLQEPSTYPTLKRYLVTGHDRLMTYNAIKNLPGIELADSLRQMWDTARRGSIYEIVDACEVAAQCGNADALSAAASILGSDKNQYELRQVRSIITKYTSATGDDPTLIAWVHQNQAKLKFDPATQKFTIPN